MHPLRACCDVARQPREEGAPSRDDEGSRSARVTAPPSYDYVMSIKPEQYIYTHFPDDTKWQLLEHPISIEQFKEQSNLRSAFFQNDFKLLSANKCVLTSNSGEPIRITIGFSRNKYTDVVFGYELILLNKHTGDGFVLETNAAESIDLTHNEDTGVDNNDANGNEAGAFNSDKSIEGIGDKDDDGGEADFDETGDYNNDEEETEIKTIEHINTDDSKGINRKETDSVVKDNREERNDSRPVLEESGSEDEIDERNFVFIHKDVQSVTYEIRFHFKGEFRLKIFGGLFSKCENDPPLIMDVKLVNEHEPEAGSVPLPLVPDIAGWGPGPITQELGLYVPSHTSSLIYVSKVEPEHVYFVLLKPLDVNVRLVDLSHTRDELSEFVHSDVETVNDVLLFRTVITHPGKGEYALRMEINVGDRLVDACNYLVHTRKDRPFEVE